MAGYLAAMAPGVQLGFAVLVPTLHHPVRLAEQIGLLDQLTGGNLIVGLGVGAGALEIAGFGRDFNVRHDLFEEAADLLVRLWSHEGGEMSYEGPSYRGVIKGRIIPRPVQLPYPPLARATRDIGRAEEWGAKGQPLLLGSFGLEHMASMLEAHNRGLARAPLSDVRREQIKDMVAIHHIIHVADTDEQAWREFQPIWDRHMEQHYYANRNIHYTRAELPPEHVEKYTAEQLMCGSPATVIKMLREYQEIGVRHHMAWMNVGDCPPELVERSLRLYAAEVMPAFS
jgi:alkanesulfonate monooxygenase SsuD/methylene tetrahydromethanopterin reductase-like flavin-dependent oxidoreductase (luciferase family)